MKMLYLRAILFAFAAIQTVESFTAPVPIASRISHIAEISAKRANFRLSETNPPERISGILQGREEDVSISTPKTVSTPKDWPSLWKRRLITSEDPFSIHKISCLLFTVLGTGILGAAGIRYLMGPEVFAEMPPGMMGPMYAFVLSNTVMCLASIRMSYLHRRMDLAARNAFLGTAASSLFSGFNFLWTNQLGPDILNDHLVTQGCFALLLLLNTVLILDTCFRANEIVEGRKDRKNNTQETNYWLDILAYVFPVAWGLPFVVTTALVDSFLGREWFFQQCQYVDQNIGLPGIQSNLSFLQVAGCFGPAFGALFVTLRDKRLISRTQEIIGITAFSVPSLIWTVLGTGTFFYYMNWD